MVDTRLSKQAFHGQKLARTKERRKTLAAERSVEHAATSAGRNDLNPKLVCIERSPASLVASEYRTRVTKPDHLARLIDAIRTFGFTVPVLVVGDEIVDGHVRVTAALELGLDRVPVIDCGHLSTNEIRQLRLAINRLANLGTDDLDLLKIEFSALIELGVDLDVTGYTSEDRDIILLDPPLPADAIDADIEPPEVSVTRVGDIWKCGEHRVVCGDARAPETFEMSMENQQVEAIIADFPFNVRISGNVSGLGKKKHEEFVMASGEMSDDEFSAFLYESIAAATKHLVSGGVFFGFMDWRSIDMLYAAGRRAGLSVVNLVVWYKSSGGMGGLYRSAHELIAVFCKGDAPRVNNVKLGKNGRDRTNVWEAPGANRRGSSANAMLHAHSTPKPVELCVDALLDVTRPGESVLDPFLGSGTTMMAAQQCGRQCFGIELDPKYVDVSIRRWEAATGRKATLAATGQSFAEIAKLRADSETEQ